MRSAKNSIRNLLAIDPGLKPGWALFDNGALVNCGTGSPALNPLGRIDDVVCELPQIYPRAKADPNDLIKLAFSAGEICGKIQAVFDWPLVFLVRPREWKGSVPKEIMWERIAAKLTSAEACLYFGIKDGASKDALEAIGIGLFHLGRMSRGGT